MNRSINIYEASRDEKLGERVHSKRGWCEITPLSGELEEGIYMATFADDSRILFEEYDGILGLLFTQHLQWVWWSLRESEQMDLLEEIVYFFIRYKQEGGK